MDLKKDNSKFDMYREDLEQNGNKEIQSVIKPNRGSGYTSWRSKFSPGEFELQALSNIKLRISDFSIKVAANTQEIDELWDLYGCINEYWARIKPIFGAKIYDEIGDLDKELLNKLQDSNINLKYNNMHKKLLYYRDKVYLAAQMINLGIETEQKSNTAHSQARRKMQQ